MVATSTSYDGHMQVNSRQIVVYGKPDCVDTLRSRKLLDDLGVAFEWRDIVASQEDADSARVISGGASVPVVVFPDGSFQVEPSNEALAGKLGLEARAAVAEDGEYCAPA